MLYFATFAPAAEHVWDNYSILPVVNSCMVNYTKAPALAWIGSWTLLVCCLKCVNPEHLFRVQVLAFKIFASGIKVVLFLYNFIFFSSTETHFSDSYPSLLVSTAHFLDRQHPHVIHRLVQRAVEANFSSKCTASMLQRGRTSWKAGLSTPTS